jgi:hypothetical protein
VSGVTCHVSQIKGNHVLNSARSTLLVTTHVSKSKMLLLRKVILQRFTLKVGPVRGAIKMRQCVISYLDVPLLVTALSKSRFQLPEFPRGRHSTNS